MLCELGVLGGEEYGLFSTYQPVCSKLAQIIDVHFSIASEVGFAAPAAVGVLPMGSKQGKVCIVHVAVTIYVADFRYALVQMHLSISGSNQHIGIAVYRAKVAIPGPVADGRS